MKKLFFLLFVAVLCCGAAFSQSVGRTMYVMVKNTEVKSSTGAFADNVGVLNLGEAVTVAGTNGKWVQIRTNKISGWVALASLSSRRVTGSANTASAGEIALAGKGFTPETELEYKKNGLDYSGVDNMEKITIPIKDLQKFVEDGRLAKGE